MTTPNEATLVEQPIIDALVSQYGYTHLGPADHAHYRDRENEVLLRPLLLEALVRINAISHAAAAAIFNDLAGISDNARWLEVLRGNFSRKVHGEKTHQTIQVIDFDRFDNNRFTVVSQLRVLGEGVRKPDLVVYVNGIPLVVIEAKSPLNTGQNAFDAIDQVHSAEKEVPRLFFSNLFSIATDDKTLLYGATQSAKEFWSQWKDPWPRKKDEFFSATDLGLYALLEPSRLLDLLAHFIVFETRDGKTIKKICRYQQYRAVNKMVERVADGAHKGGLIWHTQGSGKSLTMVFAALKLKFHRGLQSERLQNPNLLVITDRIDLHNQIASTFEACGLPNPIAASSIAQLRQVMAPGVSGRTVISTIFKFSFEDARFKSPHLAERKAALAELEIAGSENWILMVDEAHRTQEKDLGAYLRAVLPHAVRFGFTGTPVKKGDLDTFQNFGAPGEAYLDKYGIDDAVADGATVPIYYLSRMTQWHLHDKELDAVFDQWFANEPDEKLAELKQRGVTKGDLARFAPRIQLIATDLWAHYREHIQPDGFKAQICAIDRLACVAYKRALDTVIADSLVKTQGLDPAQAAAQAHAMSVCVYSPGQHDGEQHPELVEYQVAPEDVTPKLVPRFLDRDDPLCFLIVCNKLLTGFDAPIEQVLYLDNPLTDHNLLQAIARTNRRCGAQKDRGVVVDYIGVSKNLSEALAAYRKEDVETAMRDHDELHDKLHDKLRAAHRAVLELLEGAARTQDVKEDVKAVILGLGAEDAWFVFRSTADTFLKAYAALSPDARVLPYRADLKFVAALLAYGRMYFEKEEAVDWKAYSEKIRAMLTEHLEVTGLRTVCKLRDLPEAEFWADFDNPADLKTAAVRKLAELKKITTDRTAKNPARYEKFSERVKALIAQFNKGLLAAEAVLDAAKEVSDQVREEDSAHEGTGLNARAYSIASILRQFKAAADKLAGDAAEHSVEASASKPKALSKLQQAAIEIDQLYSSDETAPLHWQDKNQLRKELRGVVRRMAKALELREWQKQVPEAVEHFALQHHRKP